METMDTKQILQGLELGVKSTEPQKFYISFDLTKAEDKKVYDALKKYGSPAQVGKAFIKKAILS